MRWSVCTLLLLLSLPVELSASPEDNRTTLEHFRHQLEQRRIAALAQLTPIVEGLKAKLLSLPAAPLKSIVSDIRAEFTALPAEAAPLIVQVLDPGAQPLPGAIFASGLIFEVLPVIGLRAITIELAAMATTGTRLGRTRALELLAVSDDQLDAGPALLKLWSGPSPKDGKQLAKALLKREHDTYTTEVCSALMGESAKRIRWAVEALAEIQPAATAQAFAKFLSRGSAALRNIEAVLDFYLANPDSFGDEQARRVIALISSEPTPTATDEAILGALPELRLSTRAAWVDQLRAKAAHRLDDTGHAIRICLALLGDRTARKKALSKSEEWVDRSKRSPEAYINRAEIYMALKEYSRASSDYKTAMSFIRNYATPLRWTAGHGQARAYVLGGQLRQASLVLKSLELTPLLKREIANDPDFEKLRDHQRYGKVLE